MTLERNADGRIGRLIGPVLEDLGFELVRVRLSGDKRKTLQVMADRKDEQPMTVDDCAEISHNISAVLDVEDPIADAYSLEVSTPGIDRPLTRERDFERFAGFEAKVELDMAVNGQRRFRGLLKGLENGEVLLDTDTGPVALPYGDIRAAKLVLTDELIKASEPQIAANADDGDGEEG